MLGSVKKSSLDVSDCCYGVLDRLGHFICHCENDVIVWVNKAGIDIMQAYTAEAILGRKFTDFFDEDYRELFEGNLELLSQETESVPLIVLTVNGTKLNVILNVLVTNPDTDKECYLAEFYDISPYVKVSVENRNREERINAILKTTDQAIVEINEFGEIKSFNEAAIKIFGHSKRDAIGQNLSILIPEPHSAKHHQYVFNYLANPGARSSIMNNTRELEALRSDGSIFPIEISVTEQRAMDGSTVFIGMIKDIEEKKIQDERIRFLAMHDTLTELPNRVSFNMRLEESITRSERDKHGIAVLFLDLDGFKAINDGFGHEVGDGVLITVSERLVHTVRKVDMVSRFGGDEFVILLENVKNKKQVEVVAKKILKSLSKPINIEEEKHSVGVSIGIALYPKGADNAKDLLRIADQAMYRVKNSGKNAFSY
ncbi:MAG: diguanylate cyclase [Rhodospirillales bacterium]|jgi:diguanylate cyclase (GGDEF)-like protein/PAS domain S-box-containing protein|nr:diguanylate cyclase [Rhodospirillales bacterium]